MKEREDAQVGEYLGIACVAMPPCMEERVVFTSLGDSIRDSDDLHNVKLVKDGPVYRAKALRFISKEEQLTTNYTLYLQL